MIQHRHILDESFDNKQPAVTHTGATEPSTTGALGDETAHGDVASYKRARAAATGVFNTAGAAGVGIGGDEVDSALSREGSLPPSDSDTIGPSNSMAQRDAGGDTGEDGRYTKAI
jgi:hypothetical protein